LSDYNDEIVERWIEKIIDSKTLDGIEEEVGE